MAVSTNRGFDPLEPVVAAVEQLRFETGVTRQDRLGAVGQKGPLLASILDLFKLLDDDRREPWKVARPGHYPVTEPGGVVRPTAVRASSRGGKELAGRETPFDSLDPVDLEGGDDCRAIFKRGCNAAKFLGQRLGTAHRVGVRSRS